jgi:hypothetical protein
MRREKVILAERDPVRWEVIKTLPTETYLLFIESIPKPDKRLKGFD